MIQVFVYNSDNLACARIARIRDLLPQMVEVQMFRDAVHRFQKDAVYDELRGKAGRKVFVLRLPLQGLYQAFHGTGKRQCQRRAFGGENGVDHRMSGGR